jgi:hypothetical protein
VNVVIVDPTQLDLVSQVVSFHRVAMMVAIQAKK